MPLPRFGLADDTGDPADPGAPDPLPVSDHLGRVESDERAKVVGSAFYPHMVYVFDRLGSRDVDGPEAGQRRQCGHECLSHHQPPVIWVGIWPLSAGTSVTRAHALSLTGAV